MHWLVLTCVDNVKVRFDVAEILKSAKKAFGNNRNRPLYWLYFGNSQHTGQVILSTVGKIDQPESKKYEPITNLPFIAYRNIFVGVIPYKSMVFFYLLIYTVDDIHPLLIVQGEAGTRYNLL